MGIIVSGIVLISIFSKPTIDNIEDDYTEDYISNPKRIPKSKKNLKKPTRVPKRKVKPRVKPKKKNKELVAEMEIPNVDKIVVDRISKPKKLEKRILNDRQVKVNTKPLTKIPKPKVKPAPQKTPLVKTKAVNKVPKSIYVAKPSKQKVYKVKKITPKLKKEPIKKKENLNQSVDKVSIIGKIQVSDKFTLSDFEKGLLEKINHSYLGHIIQTFNNSLCMNSIIYDEEQYNKVNIQSGRNVANRGVYKVFIVRDSVLVNIVRMNRKITFNNSI